MTAKEYLSQVYQFEKKIKQLKLRSNEFERLSLSVPGSNYDGVRVDGTRNLDAPFVKWLMKKDEVDRSIDSLQKKVARLKHEILKVIDTLENEDYKNILIMRYLDTLTWEEIATKLYVARRTVLRWHDKAIELINIPS